MLSGYKTYIVHYLYGGFIPPGDATIVYTDHMLTC